jgi:DNA-binding NarL/FixJ family response regulator
MVVVSGVFDEPPDPGRVNRSPRTLLIDRQPLFLAALSTLLSSPPLNAEVVVRTRSSEVVDIARQEELDLVVCDVRAEPVGAAELPGILAPRLPGLKVILLADQEDEALLLNALQSGAAGFFTKDTPVAEFLEGVTAVIKGHFTVGRGLLRQVLAMMSGDGHAQPKTELLRLTPAERSILTMVGEAASVKTIAQHRGISPKTVRNHLASIYRKLSVRNRTEAILWARRMGLTDSARVAQD